MKNKNSGRMHYGYVIVICCCLMMGVNIGIVFSCAGIFYQPVSESVGVSVGEFGLYMSLMYIASTLTLPWAGKMMERHSARRLLTANSALMGAIVTGMSLFTNVIEFYIAGAALGFTVAYILYLSFPTLINRWFKTRVGLMTGICCAASGIGGVLFNPLGAWMITDFGWRTAYMVFGAMILLVSSPLLWILLRDYPKDKGLMPFGMQPGDGTVEKAASDGIEYGRAVRMPVFYGLVIFSFLMMAVSTLNLFIPKYVTGLDYTLEQASWAAASAMVGVTVGKLVLGYINDRSCVAGVLVNTLGGAAGLVLMIFGGTAGLWFVVCGAFMFGFEYAGVTVQTTMITRQVFGSVSYVRIYAIMSLALAAGGAVASGGWGLLAEATSFSFIFGCGAVAMLICLVIGIRALSMRKRLQE